MKKLFAVLLVAFVLSSFAVTAFAEPGAFVSSPSANAAPELIEAKNDVSGCTAEIVIRAYGDRASFSEADRTKIESAYASIVNTEDLGELNSSLKTLADKLYITTDKFAVSDLFDVNYINCDNHSEHGGKFTITIKPKVMENFATIMYYNGSSWEIPESFEVSDDGTQLTFKTDKFGPYAILVHDGSAVVPTDSDIVPIVVGATTAAAFIGAATTIFIVVFKKRKKKVTDIPVE